MQTATLAMIGSAADLDLLVNRHRAEAHSIGAAAVVASIAAWRAWPIASGRSRIWLAAFLAWAAHPFLDWLSADASVPTGIMALWPVTTAYYYSGVDLFISIWRHWWESGWFTHNLEAVTREILVIAPVTAAVWWWRRRD
jgi:hypothetical protein